MITIGRSLRPPVPLCGCAQSMSCALLSVTQVLHILQFIVRKNRGLRRALEKCKTELMLLGVCALLIVALSKSISGICSKFPAISTDDEETL